MFADKRFESVIDDGMKYVARTDRRFDVIIVDSTDPQGPGKVLFSQKFYAACKRCMNTGAVLVTQNGVPMFAAERARLERGQVSAPVRRRHLLRRRDPDLCRRPHGHGLGERRPAAAPDSGENASRPATARPALSRPDTGRPKSTSPPSRCRASSPTWWPRRGRGGERFVPPASTSHLLFFSRRVLPTSRSCVCDGKDFRFCRAQRCSISLPRNAQFGRKWP